ncbi:MAG: helix-turn-helix transcriptional regulator [Anaerolineae bacterium]|nr:helix-turn-helix transcriptional regulator [Anaerolineae bacterium]
MLRRRRAELGLSLGDVSLRLKARGVQLSSKTLGDYERGVRPLQLARLQQEALADALRWSLSELKDAMAASKAPQAQPYPEEEHAQTTAPTMAAD